MLHLYNSLTKKLEPFNPPKDQAVKFYTCGPSTYMRPHIGNYRTFLYEDLLQRYLEYLGYKITRLMTLTDVEDKAIAEANKEHISIEKLTSRNEALLFRDFELLRIKLPTYTIRASTAVDQAAYIVNTLTEKGIAYWQPHEGRVNAYFEPSKFKGFGKLAHLDMTKWPKKKRRFHKDTYPGTPWNRGDFIIWHGCKPGDTCWDTEIGKGRPAWNVQDAAIVTQHLGYHVDVAAGGIDNLVRHHDYTLAIAESLSGEKFADFWLHGAHLLVNGAKMSKSTGNVLYPEDLMHKGYAAEHVRFFLTATHYRKRLNFNPEKFDHTAKRLDALKKLTTNLQQASATSSSKEAKLLANEIITEFEEQMNHDLDLATAIDRIFQILSRLDTLNRHKKLSPQDAAVALDALQKVDNVMKSIF